jgi:hypothetical protein
MEEGLLGLESSLSYNSRLRRVIWSIQNTTSLGQSSSQGRWMDIDAISGQILASGEWMAAP